MRASDTRVRGGGAMAAVLALAACGGSSASASPTPDSLPYPNGPLANTRDATASTISSANVSKLAEAWTFKLTGKSAVGVRPYGSLTANPIVVNGVVYLQDLDSNVYGLALATG